ncbi:D-xylose transporter XylE [Mangrovibacterium diazotrophicum]|uniref:SP family xylose:H+ symportor-like MFS transporter n=1 Tax=Mangrovibacterium diazotrophicum TaxID=1261403 RepID=A0A419VVC7_9BACT|nr:D-xylose transporter XylE [Mangrovibacterium diazotrophicum]RKD86016.1 SP family xylose:H+ symportor-like MFS transporter [Mangrovibacterium diazotrophicum]
MKQSNFFIIAITIVATLGGLLFGYDTAVISGTVGSLDVFFIKPMGLGETAANSQLGFIVSSALIGCIIGGISGGLVSLKLGRRNGLILAAILFFISALGSSYPEMFFRPFGEGDHTFYWHFVIYRIIGGIGVGLASMLSPMYIAEIAPANIRGRLVSFNQFAIIFGMLVVYFVNYAIARQGDDSWLNTIGWRYMFGSEMIPAGLFLVLLLFVPATPRFMALKGNDEKALQVLCKINGPERGKQVLTEIKQTLTTTSSGKLFSFGFLVIVIGILLSAFQQFVGINVVLYYAPEIFKTMGSGTDTALLQTIIVGIINLSFTVVAILTVDKFGRKPLMIIGAAGMAFFMFALGFAFFFQQVGLAALIFMLGYVACFAVSWGPVVWVLLAEIFPNRVRGRAMAVAVAAQWISNWLVSWSFPIMNKSSFLVENFHNGFAYWIYGVMGVLAALFMWKFVPETKGKTLEEMEQLWKK